MELKQQTQQTMQQAMKLKSVQLQSLQYLYMGIQELEEEVAKIAQENPALKVLPNAFGNSFGEHGTHISSNVSNARDASSLSYQNALENTSDKRKTLTSHLLWQISFLNLEKKEYNLAQKLVGLLDEKGFFLYSPFGLLKNANNAQENIYLCSLIRKLQTLDPKGCFCFGTEHSLFVQALLKEKSSNFHTQIKTGVLYILNGNLSRLENLDICYIQKFLNDYVKENQKKTFGKAFLNEGRIDFPVEFSSLPQCNRPFEKKDIEKIITFVKTLSPNPASNFGQTQTVYAFPEVEIQEIHYEGVNEDNIILSNKETNKAYRVHLINDYTKKIKIDCDIEKYAKKGELKKSLLEAKELIRELLERQSTILTACIYIVQRQVSFFDNGPGNLSAFLQKDLAKLMNRHNSTISRLAQNKYLQCKWGIFPLKYFFCTSVSNGVSKDKILSFIKKTLKKTPDMTDMQMSSLLEENGMKVARRTVAKYRKILNIGIRSKRKSLSQTTKNDMSLTKST